MNVTLIYPLLSRRRSGIDENKQFWPPLGLAYIAGVLENGAHKVQIIDRDLLLRKNNMDFDKVDSGTAGLIKEFDSRVVGISATTPNMSDVNHLSDYIKKNVPGSFIVLGGPHPSGEPVLSLEENPSVDIVVRGEGEFAMREISDGRPCGEIPGVTYRKDDKIVSTPDREPIADIDTLPFPARHLLDMKFYTRPSRFTSRNLSLRTTSIFTARGCPYRCNFCAGPLVFNGKVRFHSPDRVISEIEELLGRYSIEALYFAEDMFLSSKKRAEELLGLFIDKGINRKIKWIAQAKASIITEDLLRLMKTAGCVGIEYGFESGSQRVLDLMNKRLKVEESIHAADLTRRARLRFQANIITGYPGEKEEDFKETVSFIKRIKANMIGFNLFMPLPGTPSYEQLKLEGKKLPRWDDIGDPEAPQMNFADMPEETFEKLYLEARLKVVLPLNLRYFIVDNIRNPVRLARISLTQFKGVLVKTARSIVKLASLKKSTSSGKVKVLFLSYNGLLEPILPSQAIPYMKELAKKEFEFLLLTYEKKADLDRVGKAGIGAMREDLKRQGIDWRYLNYHKRPPIVSTLYDLAAGFLVSLRLIKKHRIRIVHVRGITPGMIMILLSKLLKVRILFDMRGLLAEEYVGGGLWKEGGLAFRTVKAAERHMLKIADAVTVLTKKHLEFNKHIEYLRNNGKPMDIIPCCVDTDRFYHDEKAGTDLKKRLGLSDRFVLMYPGKIGTFYLMREMLDFFKVMRDELPESVFLVITNDNTSELLAIARKAGLHEGSVKVINGIGFEEMPEYMRLADAGIFFINPYKKIGSSPIKMGEFLASGIPVVINPGVGDTEEMVLSGGAGVVVRSFDEKSYRDAVKAVLRLKSEGPALVKRCRETADSYLALDKGVCKYREIYKAIL